MVEVTVQYAKGQNKQVREQAKRVVFISVRSNPFHTPRTCKTFSVGTSEEGCFLGADKPRPIGSLDEVTLFIRQTEKKEALEQG